MLLTNFLNIDLLENFLRNATFLSLFFTMLFYWINTAFSPRVSVANVGNQEQNSATKTTKTWPQPIMSLPTSGAEHNSSTNKGVLGRTCMFLSNLLLMFLLVVRWEKSGHFPLSNLYESLMFLAWCCTFLYLIYCWPRTYRAQSNINRETDSDRSDKKFLYSSIAQAPMGGQSSLFLDNILGSIIAPCALLMNSFATFSLPKEMQQASPLVPALQSNWLMMHVTVMIISYATLIIGSLLSILFLILKNILEHSSAAKTTSSLPAMLAPDSGAEQSTNVDNIRSTNFILKLDFLSYRIIGLGFPFLTIGILSGAVWANEAWGSYWSWDPKETWALLTWLVFAIYLHTRFTKGWQGEKPAFIATAGFLVVWFCYLGVNLIGEGLHSYGFFKV